MPGRGGWSHVGAVARDLIPVRRHRVPRGDGQTRATLGIMARTARAAVTDPAVVDAAVAIVRAIHGRDRPALIDEIAGWAAARLMFLEDPRIAGDWIRTPAKLLEEVRRHGVARGDCDDAAVLVAALGLAVGIPARFHAVAFSRGGPFQHVWTELFDGEKWVVVDPTREGKLPMVGRSMTLDV